MIIQIPLRVKFTGNEKWVCEDEMEFPSVGVKVTRVQMIVTPLDVRCEVQAVVTDEELYNAQEEEVMLALYTSRSETLLSETISPKTPAC